MKYIVRSWSDDEGKYIYLTSYKLYQNTHECSLVYWHASSAIREAHEFTELVDAERIARAWYVTSNYTADIKVITDEDVACD